MARHRDRIAGIADFDVCSPGLQTKAPSWGSSQRARLGGSCAARYGLPRVVNEASEPKPPAA